MICRLSSSPLIVVMDAVEQVKILLPLIPAHTRNICSARRKLSDIAEQVKLNAIIYDDIIFRVFPKDWGNEIFSILIVVKITERTPVMLFMERHNEGVWERIMLKDTRDFEDPQAYLLLGDEEDPALYDAEKTAECLSIMRTSFAHLEYLIPALHEGELIPEGAPNG